MTNQPEWEILLQSGAEARATMREAKRESSKFLWRGAVAAIEDWRYDSDPTGEVLYSRTLAAMGGSRKGSASKIKTVALTHHHFGLMLSEHKSLNAAYEAARRITGADKVEREIETDWLVAPRDITGPANLLGLEPESGPGYCDFEGHHPAAPHFETQSCRNWRAQIINTERESVFGWCETPGHEGSHQKIPTCRDWIPNTEPKREGF